MYAPAEKHTLRYVLCLHNVTFCHAIAVRKVFKTLQVLTHRKLFAIHYHSISCYAPLTAPLIYHSLVDTEEEREFSTINSISKSTSNDHPEHTIPNSIIRVQAERSFSSKKSVLTDQQSKIGQFTKNLQNFTDTSIPDELLGSEIHQAHLEQISYFLPVRKGYLVACTWGKQGNHISWQ